MTYTTGYDVVFLLQTIILIVTIIIACHNWHDNLNMSTKFFIIDKMTFIMQKVQGKGTLLVMKCPSANIQENVTRYIRSPYTDYLIGTILRMVYRHGPQGTSTQEWASPLFEYGVAPPYSSIFFGKIVKDKFFTLFN